MPLTRKGATAPIPSPAVFRARGPGDPGGPGT
jgi:hypothetical protein